MIAWRLEQYSELDSTSDTCIKRARTGEAAGLAVIAQRQTAGRGSRGRHWVSGTGNLALSVLLRPGIKASECGVFPLLAGIAVAEAVEQFLPPGRLPMLKWPNDVLLEGAKLAGLLIDAGPQNGRIDWLVIGIGINLLHRPEIAGRAITALADYGISIEPLTAGQAVLDRLAVWLDCFTEQGAEPIRQRWLDLGHPSGTPIEVCTLQKVTAGAFAGLSPMGELLLRVEDRIETFQTGEILLGLRD